MNLDFVIGIFRSFARLVDSYKYKCQIRLKGWIIISYYEAYYIKYIV